MEIVSASQFSDEVEISSQNSLIGLFSVRGVDRLFKG